MTFSHTAILPSKQITFTIVDASSSNDNFENTDANAANNPAITAYFSTGIETGILYTQFMPRG